MKGYCWLLLIPLMLAVSCGGGGGGGGAPPTIDSSGDWVGTWLSVTGIDGGTISLSLVQNGADVSGTVSLTGSPCFFAGNVSGFVSGNNASGSLFFGSLSVDFDATVVGSQMNGSYDAVVGGACTGDTGTWVAQR